MFNKPSDRPGTPRSSGSGAMSFLGPEITVTGNIGGTGNLHIDGTVTGDVAASSLTLGSAGTVHGNIVVDEAQIAGTVDGTIAAHALTIEATARITGDLSYDTVSVANGAQVEGRVKRLTRSDDGAMKLIASS